MKRTLGIVLGGGRRRIGFVLYAVFGTALGVALLWWLLTRFGALAWRQLDQAWPTVPLAVAAFLLPLTAATISWRRLFPRRRRPPRLLAAHLTWVGLGVNWLLPVAMIGGELVKLRLARRHGLHGPAVVASLVGDKTLQVSTQLFFTVVGLVLLGLLSGHLAMGWQGVAGLAVFALALAGFYRAQQGGLFSGLAGKLGGAGGRGENTAYRAARLDVAVRRMHRRRSAWWTAAAWRMAFRLLLAVEVWLAFWWLGRPIGVIDAIALESLAQGARAAAFFIPAGVGAQEGGLVAAGLLLGLPGDVLLLVALVKRARELLVGGGALLAWQAEEAHGLLRRRARIGEPPSPGR